MTISFRQKKIFFEHLPNLFSEMSNYCYSVNFLTRSLFKNIIEIVSCIPRLFREEKRQILNVFSEAPQNY